MRYFRLLVTGVRWWFGGTYLIAAVAALVAGPIMIATGNYGGFFMVIGSIMLGALGWAVHPWGLQRRL